MARHIWLNSVLHKEGKNYPIDMEDWAAERLSPEEYKDFVNDYHAWNEVQQFLCKYHNGKINLITEQFVSESGEKIEIHVGYDSTFPDNCIDLANVHGSYDPEKLYPYNIDKWLLKMSNDPNIVVFNTIQRVE